MTTSIQGDRKRRREDVAEPDSASGEHRLDVGEATDARQRAEARTADRGGGVREAQHLLDRPAESRPWMKPPRKTSPAPVVSTGVMRKAGRVDRAIAVEGQRAVMPSVTHNSPSWSPQSAQRRFGSPRVPVSASGTCSAKIGMVTAATSSSVRSVRRSMSLVTRTPSRPIRAAAIAAS